MTLLTLGLNHKVAPIKLREKLTFSPAQSQQALLELIKQEPVHEAIILSTCNRTEVYYKSLPEAELNSSAFLQAWLSEHCTVVPEELDACCYALNNRQAIQHLLRVANGLDSMVIGESQILGQIKSAYSLAESVGAIGSHLRRLFQYVFSVSKQIRTMTGIGTNPISLAFVAVDLAKRIFTDLTKTNVLLIGAGQTIELVTSYLHDINAQQLIIAGRSRRKALNLAERFNGIGISLEEMPKYLANTDIIISATSSPLPVLDKSTLVTALKSRKRRPMLLLDIAAPRDIDPDIAECEDIYLYNLDDLQQVIADGYNQRQHAAKLAEAMIDAHVEYFIRRLQSLDAVDTIKSYRQQVANVREQCLVYAMQRLQRGADPGDVLVRLAHDLSNKLMHEPCTQLRRASFDGCVELMQSAKQLLGIE